MMFKSRASVHPKPSTAARFIVLLSLLCGTLWGGQSLTATPRYVGEYPGEESTALKEVASPPSSREGPKDEGVRVLKK